MSDFGLRVERRHGRRWSTSKVDLSQMAFAGHIYRRYAYDGPLVALRAEIGDDPDLSKSAVSLAILRWLNTWKCRICEDDFGGAAAELAKWQDACRTLLPGPAADLLEMTEGDMVRVGASYADLFDRRADRRRRFQATATAKVLFALRPKALLPWDEAIRDGLGFDGSGESYARFLKHSQEELRELRKSCEAAGVDIAEVPAVIYRPASTLAKLVDEYNFVTITKKFRPPDWLTLVQWLAWSMAGHVDDAMKPLLDSLTAVLRDPGRIWVDPNAVWELREISRI